PCPRAAPLLPGVPFAAARPRSRSRAFIRLLDQTRRWIARRAYRSLPTLELLSRHHSDYAPAIPPPGGIGAARAPFEAVARGSVVPGPRDQPSGREHDRPCV